MTTQVMDLAGCCTRPHSSCKVSVRRLRMGRSVIQRLLYPARKPLPLKVKSPHLHLQLFVSSPFSQLNTLYCVVYYDEELENNHANISPREYVPRHRAHSW
jgi:hypothetical protein